MQLMLWSITALRSFRRVYLGTRGLLGAVWFEILLQLMVSGEKMVAEETPKPLLIHAANASPLYHCTTVLLCTTVYRVCSVQCIARHRCITLSAYHSMERWNTPKTIRGGTRDSETFEFEPHAAGLALQTNASTESHLLLGPLCRLIHSVARAE